MKKLTIAEFTKNKHFEKTKSNWVQHGFTKKIRKPKRKFIEDMLNPILCNYHTIYTKLITKRLMYHRFGQTSLTKEFVEYKNNVAKKLPIISEEEENYLHCQNFCFFIHFYVKEENTNVNNLLPPFQVVIDEFYKLNEKVVVKTIITKNISEREYIRFRIARVRGRKTDKPKSKNKENLSAHLFDFH